MFDWHAHDNEDEAFLVLRGRIAIDFRDGAVELGEGDFIVVPKTVEHRPRSLTPEPVVLMFEPATTLNTGNAKATSRSAISSGFDRNVAPTSLLSAGHQRLQALIMTLHFQPAGDAGWQEMVGGVIAAFRRTSNISQKGV